MKSLYRLDTVHVRIGVVTKSALVQEWLTGDSICSMRFGMSNGLCGGNLNVLDIGHGRMGVKRPPTGEVSRRSAYGGYVDGSRGKNRGGSDEEKEGYDGC